MNKIKLLYIEANLDGTIGGSHHCLLEIVKHLNRNNFEPVVVFYQENPLTTDFKKLCQVFLFERSYGFVFERDTPSLFRVLRKNNIAERIILFFQKAYNFFRYYIPGVFNIACFLRNKKIDVIHANNSPDVTDWLIVSKLLNVKIISHNRGPWYPSKIRKRLIRYYDKIISISKFVTDQMISEGIPCKNVVIVHDGIDIEFSSNADLSKEDFLQNWRIPENASVIGLIGNIRRWKGQHVAVEALKYVVREHGNLRCIFVGETSNSLEDMEYLKYLKELVFRNDLQEHIIFAGYQKNVFGIISSLDILIHTSILPEPLGRVVLEGMTFRKPVIATRHGGPIEIIEDGVSGFLVPPNDPLALAEKICFLLENKDVGKKIGENGRKRVEEEFSIEKNVRKIEEIYLSLLGGEPRHI